MNCAEIEILICEYVDGTLPEAQRAEVERHLADCPACAELARDSAAAVAFMESAADVEPPPELVTRILFDAPWSKGKHESRSARVDWRAVESDFAAEVRDGHGDDDSVAVDAGALRDAGAAVAPGGPRAERRYWRRSRTGRVRTWARTVKFYENLKVVYQIQTTLREWQQQTEEQKPAAGENRRAASFRSKLLPRTPGGRRFQIRPGNDIEGKRYELPESSRNSSHGLLPHLRQSRFATNAAVTLRNGLLRGAHARCLRASAATVGLRAAAAGAPGPCRDTRDTCTADVSPGLAFFLGMIPGVGAIYNGQYAKGLVHAVVLGVLVQHRRFPGLATALELGLRHDGVRLVDVYMVFEAYHTARKRRNRRAGGRVLEHAQPARRQGPDAVGRRSP